VSDETKNELIKLPEFEGNDMMPMELLAEVEDEDRDEVVGTENLDMDDVVLPALILMGSKSPDVEEGREGAKPGKFLHYTTGDYLDAPIRGIAIFHNKSRSIGKEMARDEGIDRCWSQDAINGSKHGDCETCPYASQWVQRGGGNKPVCALANEITLVLAGYGPVRVRFAGGSFQSGKNFVGNWLMSRRNLWHHPIILSSRLTTSKGGHKYWQANLQWDRTTVLPKAMRDKARGFYEQIAQAFEHGRLRTGGEVDEG
jgi:hypothetical protein